MNESLSKEISEIILKYFGHSTAEVYADFYHDQPDDLILLSFKELLTEYLGEEKAQEEFNKLNQR